MPAIISVGVMAPGRTGDGMVPTSIDDLAGEAGGDDEARPGAHRLIDLAGIDDGSGADGDPAVTGHGLDGGWGGIGTEGHLGDRKATDDQPVGDGWGSGGVMDDDYWDDQM